jgi:nicotinamidase-related amidase
LKTKGFYASITPYGGDVSPLFLFPFSRLIFCKKDALIFCSLDAPQVLNIRPGGLKTMPFREWPIPLHYRPEKVAEVWRVPYQERAFEAERRARERVIRPSTEDTFRICLLPVDVQNTFCIPGFELYVGGRSGTGAVDDNRRLCEFIYRNLGVITEICPTMDTHQAVQIFHSIFLTNDMGEHPAPFTLISEEDLRKGVWMFNPAVGYSLQISENDGRQFLLHYARQLKAGGKYDLTIWPYHAMLGGIGYALVSSLEEAIFFHTIARYSQAGAAFRRFAEAGMRIVRSTDPLSGRPGISDRFSK